MVKILLENSENFSKTIHKFRFENYLALPRNRKKNENTSLKVLI